MTTIHFGLLSYDYSDASRSQAHINVVQLLRRDLERPFFEPYGFCGAWVLYSSGQSTDLGLNFPAYVGATLAHSALSQRVSCVDALMTPRGQILTSLFVPPIWFMVGLSFRRMAGRRWRRTIAGQAARALLSIGLLLLPLGILLLVLGLLSLFISESSQLGKVFGLAFWMFYISTLIAERLWVWPFKSYCTHRQPQPTI
jgi:hypothetical protein